MKKLQVLSIAPAQTKTYAGKTHSGGTDVRTFNNITYSNPVKYMDAEGEIITATSVKTATIASFNYGFLPNAAANPLFGSLAVGDKVAGDIVTVDTEPFQIDERRNGVLTGNKVTITKDTFPVFANSDNETEWTAAVEDARKARADQRAKAVISAASVAGATV